MERSARALLFVVAAACGGAGCASTHAQVVAAPVALDTPAPPPRVVIPETIEPEPPPAPAPAPAPVDTTPTRATRPATTARPAPPADPAPTPTATPPEAPPPVLQTAPGPGVAEEMERRTRTRLDAAAKDLAGVHYNDLSAEAKAQYDRAQGLIRQANTALKVKNYPFAEELAGKAATLASQLRKLNDPTFS